jgi:hypothetical protein
VVSVGPVVNVFNCVLSKRFQGKDDAMRHRTLGFLALIALSVSSMADAAAPTGACVELAPLRTVSTDHRPVRPERSVHCSYSAHEFVDRIIQLSADKDAVDSVETAQKAFGLPRMSTAQNDPRVASYQMQVSGDGGWMAFIWVMEGFYPSNKGPARFVPGAYPKRLADVRAAKLSISFDMPALPNNACVPVSALFDALTKAGWQEVPWNGPHTPADPQTHPQFQYQDKRVGVYGQRGDCTQEIHLIEVPKSP